MVHLLETITSLLILLLCQLALLLVDIIAMVDSLMFVDDIAMKYSLMFVDDIAMIYSLIFVDDIAMKDSLMFVGYTFDRTFEWLNFCILMRTCEI